MTRPRLMAPQEMMEKTAAEREAREEAMRNKWVDHCVNTFNEKRTVPLTILMEIRSNRVCPSIVTDSITSDDLLVVVRNDFAERLCIAGWKVKVRSKLGSSKQAATITVEGWNGATFP